ncbi:hypothetical protein ABL78_6369 [Leptomonas seymouri]|uniref:Uncharacterized protein n=1 Tax=Leptomonas seymouri TaxID=5684 RepID=A0A0N0P3V7_LEPSE|nr:hypothetical protein ABL78_6369 [Leptomonas seymouri]|eukprot:KPI84579.1 hypothetical protein ABL78_6369 [Leptomonas seymouri]
MGNGSSSNKRAGSERPPSRPHSAAGGAPRKQHMLANQAPRRPTSSFRSPAAARAAALARQNALHSAEAKSMALQRAAAQRRAEINPAEDEAIRAFTSNADPKSLRVLQLIQQADAVQNNPAEKLRVLRQCYPLLEEVPKERFDQLAVTVYQLEGDIYHQQMDIQSAKDTFSRAITLAEKRVARQDADMYVVLKRYVLAMIGLARIWYDHERDHQGFQFVDRRHPKMPAVDVANSEDSHSSLGSLESSLSSDGGSVFSLNVALLRSMAPRPPRRQTGPLFTRLKLKAPHTVKSSLFTREDEFVLHSHITRELVASPCELLLLRCCEVVQIGHNAQSELLIPPQIELAQIYEDLALYSRALLLVRRCLGILCSVYDYDHPWVIQLLQRSDRLKELLDNQLRNESATKIQATWKMHKAMQALADTLGHPVKRHQWIPQKYRATPDLDYLGDFIGDMPDNGLLGEGSEAPKDPRADLQDPKTWAVVPQTVPVPEVPLNSGHPRRDSSYGNGGMEPPYPTALANYAPAEHREGGETFTAMVSNATVIGTTQDTQTDTDVQHTEFGDVLTVRTTTVTKTITEDLARSDEDEQEEEGPEDYEDDESTDSPREVAPPQQQASLPPPPPPPPPPPHESLYSDEDDEFQDMEEDSYDDEHREEEEEEDSQNSPQDTSTDAQPSWLPHPPYVDASARALQSPPKSSLLQTPMPTTREQRVWQTQSQAHASAPSVEVEPPRVQPTRRTKQIPVQPLSEAVGTQKRVSPLPLSSPAATPSPVAASLPRHPSSTQQQPRGVPLPPSTSRQPRQAAAGTQYEVEPSTNGESISPKFRQQQRQPIVSPHAEDDIPSLVMHGSLPKREKERAPSERHEKQPQPSESDYGEDNDNRAEGDAVEGGYLPPAAPPRVYTAAVVHNSKREPLRCLVEPGEVYPMDANGAPIFLPPMPHRAGLGPNGLPQPPNAEKGQLAVRVRGRNGGQRNGGALHPCDPYQMEPDTQPGMPMALPSPANGYPRNTQNAPLLPPPPTKKVTRDHRTITTRITRMYRRSGVTDSEDGTEADKEDEGVHVFEHESGSSWETSGSVSWDASGSNRSEVSGNGKPPASEACTPSGCTKVITRNPDGTSTAVLNSKNGNNRSPKANHKRAAGAQKPPRDHSDDSVKPEIVNSSVAHHVKHRRRSKTTKTVRHLDDSTE